MIVRTCKLAANKKQALQHVHFLAEAVLTAKCIPAKMSPCKDHMPQPSDSLSRSNHPGKINSQGT